MLQQPQIRRCYTSQTLLHLQCEQKFLQRYFQPSLNFVKFTGKIFVTLAKFSEYLVCRTSILPIKTLKPIKIYTLLKNVSFCYYYSETSIQINSLCDPRKWSQIPDKIEGHYQRFAWCLTILQYMFAISIIMFKQYTIKYNVLS